MHNTFSQSSGHFTKYLFSIFGWLTIPGRRKLHGDRIKFSSLIWSSWFYVPVYRPLSVCENCVKRLIMEKIEQTTPGQNQILLTYMVLIFHVPVNDPLAVCENSLKRLILEKIEQTTP
jgi:hypothetical protein